MMVAVGCGVLIAKLFELAKPVPASPSAFRTLVISNVIEFDVSVMPALGVSVAVKVSPPSEDDTADRVAFGTVKALFAKPKTFSEKVIVTNDVSPILSAVVLTTMVAVGGDAALADVETTKMRTR